MWNETPQEKACRRLQVKHVAAHMAQATPQHAAVAGFGAVLATALQTAKMAAERSMGHHGISPLLQRSRNVAIGGAALVLATNLILDAREGAQRYKDAVSAGEVPITAAALGADVDAAGGGDGRGCGRGGVIIRICGRGKLPLALQWPRAGSEKIVPVAVGSEGGKSFFREEYGGPRRQKNFSSAPRPTFLALKSGDLLNIEAWRRLAVEPSWCMRRSNGGCDCSSCRSGHCNNLLVVEADALPPPFALMDPSEWAQDRLLFFLTGGRFFAPDTWNEKFYLLCKYEADCAFRIVGHLAATALKLATTATTSGSGGSSSSDAETGAKSAAMEATVVRVLLTDNAAASAHVLENAVDDAHPAADTVIIDGKAALFTAIAAWAEAASAAAATPLAPGVAAGGEPQPEPQPELALPAREGASGVDTLSSIGRVLSRGIEAAIPPVAAAPSRVVNAAATRWRRAFSRGGPPVAAAAAAAAAALPRLVYDTSCPGSFKWVSKVMQERGWAVVDPARATGAEPVLVYHGSMEDDERTLAEAAKHLVRGRTAEGAPPPPVLVVFSGRSAAAAATTLFPSLSGHGNEVLSIESLGEEAFDFVRSRLRVGKTPAEVQAELDDAFAVMPKPSKEGAA